MEKDEKALKSWLTCVARVHWSTYTTQTDINKKKKLVPEQQGENREWADINSTSCNGSENPSNKTGENQNQTLTEAKVLDLVVGDPFVLSEMFTSNCCYIKLAYSTVN